MDFKNKNERDFYIKDMQSLAIATIDKLNKENKELLRIRRKEAKDEGRKLDENGLKYGYVDERKLALTSYIATFPEYVNEERVKKLAEIKIGRFESHNKAKANNREPVREKYDLGYHHVKSNDIGIIDFGKSRVIGDIPMGTYIHEMIHTTSFGETLNKDDVSRAEKLIYRLLEEGITEAKTQRIISSAEFRELAKQYDYKMVDGDKSYLAEQILAISLDILTDGKLFKEHCEDRESFDKVLTSVFNKVDGIESAIFLCSKCEFYDEDFIKFYENFEDAIYFLLPYLEAKEVNNDNALQFTELFNLGSNLKRYTSRLDKELDNFRIAMLDKVKTYYEFSEDRNEVIKAKAEENALKDNVTYLKWLDDKGFTKTNMYAKFLYSIGRDIANDNDKLALYYEEASAGKPKGAITEGDIWKKAKRIAYNRGDDSMMRQIDEKILENADNITKKEFQSRYDGMTGEYIPGRRILEIDEANRNNEAYKNMGIEDRVNYIKTMYGEDIYLGEHCDNILQDFSKLDEMKLDKEKLQSKYDGRTGENLSKKRLREIEKAYSTNKAYQFMGIEDRLNYIKNTYSEDTLLCEYCDEQLKKWEILNQMENDDWMNDAFDEKLEIKR